MVAQVREKMRSGEFCFQLFPFGDGHLAPKEFAEVEANTHAIYSDEIRDVFEVIDVTIESRFLLLRANEYRVDADDAATRADHFDLFIADVAFDVVKIPRVRVRNDEWLR